MHKAAVARANRLAAAAHTTAPASGGRIATLPPGLTFHALRHTYASLCVAAGIPPLHLSRFMGHAKVTTTLAIYTHLFDDDHAETMAALEAMGRPVDSPNVVPIRPARLVGANTQRPVRLVVSVCQEAHRKGKGWMRIWCGVLALAAVAFASAACGSQSSDRETVTVTPSSAQPTKLSGMQEYQSAQAIADDLTRFGHTCALAPFNNGFAVDGGQCTTDVGQLKLSVYLTQSKLDEQLQFVKDYVGRTLQQPYGWLVGSRWSIDCGNRAACETIKADLGGSVSANV